jgi:hypothetical protein
MMNRSFKIAIVDPCTETQTKDNMRWNALLNLHLDGQVCD